jgi:hypothetical protein
VGVRWGCEMESLQNTSVLKRWLMDKQPIYEEVAHGQTTHLTSSSPYPWIT